MAIEPPTDTHAYDETAQAEVKRLVNGDQIPEALSFLAAHEPRDRDQRIDYEIVNGVIQQALGNYRGARSRFAQALRLTARRPARRVYARTRLAGVLYRTWETQHGERQLRKALADVRAHGREAEQEAWLLGGLGMIHLTRGHLTLATQLFEQSLARLGEDPAHEIGRYQMGMNLALSLSEHGELDRARAVLDRLLGDSPPLQAGWRTTHVWLAAAAHALYADDIDRCEAALTHARDAAPENNFRARVLVEQYAGEVEIARGRAREALPRFEALLQEILRTAPHGDHVPMAARLLATSLLAHGRAEEALERAQLGARVARPGDTLEWLLNMCLAGECLAALGRRREAREAWAELRAVLDTTEFVMTRRKLESVIHRHEHGAQTDESREPRTPAVTASSVQVFRLALRSGRWFATTDADLIGVIRMAAESPLPVLLEGETGTGKDLVAHLLHELGPDPDQPFVVVDCAALPEGLVEAELFGAARGAFTGAIERRGLVAAADGGTLFLDELPELPVPLQAKLLRVLQDGSYRRVGEDHSRQARIRVIAATSRDVETLVLSGALKPDLFYRLNGYRIQLPSLGTQPYLLSELARHYAREAGCAGIRDSGLARLLAQTWPGNVRQLEMAVRAAAARAGTGAWLDADSFTSVVTGTAEGHESTLRESRLEGERETLRRVLALHHGNIAAAARALSMSRQGLHKALRRAGLI
jgi:DNA-binding NtrC family response regulator/tetratricopeptide (TPR) repeat protein